MEVLATTDTSRPGNDCYIHSSVALVEQFGIFAIIVVDKITGWVKCSEMNVVYQTESHQKAINAFKERGGVLSSQEKRTILNR